MAEVRPTRAEPAATRPEAEVRPAPDGPMVEWRVGDVIEGTYEVRQVFAAGGMGLVYHVRHRGWGLDLAVKRPRPEFFRTDAQRADFEREAEAWADLGLHPHVVTCHYVRRIGGVPCVFAEFAPGGSLADLLRDGPLPPPDALDAAVQAAWGLDHAHARGLVHQDVKPANLLTAGRPAGASPRETLPDDAPPRAGAFSVKVTDFGLAGARATVETGTHSRRPGQTLAVVGIGLFTPEYAAPEQFAGERLTRRTDVWSWGITALELLTGRRPAVGPAAPELLRTCDRAAWPAGLFDLLYECLSVEPDRRPADMTAVAARLVEAYRRSTGSEYPRRAPRAARLDLDSRNNRAVSLADLGKVDEAEALWAEVVRTERDHPEAGYNLGLRRWRAGRQTFDELVADLREIAAAFPDDPRPPVLAARAHLESGDPTAAGVALGPHRGPDADAVRAAVGAKVERLPKRAWAAAPGDAATAVVWAGERLVVTAHRDRALRVWSAPDGRLVHTLTGHSGVPDRLVASADGRIVLSGSSAQDTGAHADLIAWEVATGTRLWVATHSGSGPPGETSVPLAVSGSDPPSGALVPLAVDDALAVSFDGSTLQVWSAGRALVTVPNAGFAAFGGGGVVTLIGSDDETRLRVWDLPDPRPVAEFPFPSGVDGLSVGGDGQTATGRLKGRLRAWDLATGTERAVPPSGERFAVTAGGPAADTPHLLTVRRAATDRPVAVLAPHGLARGNLRAALGPGDRLATASDDGVALWTLDPAAEPFDAPPAVCVARRSEAVVAAEEVCDAALTAGREAAARRDWAAAAAHVRTARAQLGANRRADALALWSELSEHLARGPFRRGWWADAVTAPGMSDLAMTRDGRRVLIAERSKFRVWDAAAARAVVEIDAPAPRTVALAPDGATAFTATGIAGRDLRLGATAAATGKAVWEAVLPPLTVGFGEMKLSGDGRALFSVHGDHSVRRWDASTGELLATYTGRLGGVRAVAPADDGDWFAAVDLDGAVRVIDSATGRARRTLVRTRGQAVAAAGRFVLVGCASDDDPFHRSAPVAPEDVLTVWDAGTGTRVRSLSGPLEGASLVALAADGALAVAAHKHAAAAWDAETGALLRSFPAHGDDVFAIAAGDDRKSVVTATGEGVRLWTLDWELTDEPRPARPEPEPIAWDEAFDAFRLAVRSGPPPEPPPPPPPEPLWLKAAKLVLTADGLYRGRPGGSLERLHLLNEIIGIGLRRRHNGWAGATGVGGLAAGALGYHQLTAGWGWAAAGVGVALALASVVAWRFPLLRVTTAAGTAEYEIHDASADAAAFAASVRLAAGG